jgi:arylsulfatase A-like enzyme
VPLLVRWAQITKPGSRIDQPAIGTDPFPMTLHAARIDTPSEDGKPSDGMDLRPLLEGKTPAARTTLALAACLGDGGAGIAAV